MAQGSQKLIVAFSHDLEDYFLHGFSKFIGEYRQRILKDISCPVRFHDNARIWQGDFQAIEDDGSITLRLPENISKTFLVGEILWDSNHK